MNLGTVDLAQEGENRFQVKGLPPGRRFVLGIHLESGNCEIERSDVHVTLLMTEGMGKELVIREEAALRQLTWATNYGECVPALGYATGSSQEVVINGKGDTCSRPVITGADNGWGTYFDSRESIVYEVVLKVERVPPSIRHSATVVVEDDGPVASNTRPCR
jgi:hypothetical protein